MGDEKRMADSYEITQAIHVGDKEVVFGIDEHNTKNLKYMCAFYQKNVLFSQYIESMVSDDYLEIMKLFAERVSAQCDRTRAEVEQVTVPIAVIMPEQCVLDDWEKSIAGKVVVLRPEVLRQEYRTANNQLWLCDRGFGTQSKSRGAACYAINLYSGESSRFERRDVLGEMKVLPEWAKERLAVIQAEREANRNLRKKDRGAR